MGQAFKNKKVIRRLSDLPSYSELLVQLIEREVGNQSGQSAIGAVKDALQKHVNDCTVLLDSERKTLCLLVRESGSRAALMQLSQSVFSWSDRHGYEVNQTLEVSDDVMTAVNTISEQVQTGEAMTAQDSTLALNIAERLLRQAIVDRASDIHISANRDSALVEMRIDGALRVVEEWSPDKAKSVIQVIYRRFGVDKSDFSDMKIQSTNVEIEIDGVVERFRYEHCPLGKGELRAVLRSSKTVDVETHSLTEGLVNLGFFATQAHLVDVMVNSGKGLIILSGTTGSGKTTTLKVILEAIHRDRGGEVCILSAEDPIEYKMQGVRQIDVGVSGVALRESLDSMLRQDPDIVVQGEIRKPESVAFAATATQTGHLVLGTLHAASATGCIPRLALLGAESARQIGFNPVDRSTITGPRFIAGLIHQTLLPLVCHECSRSFQELIEDGTSGVLDERWLTRRQLQRYTSLLAGDPDTIRIRNPNGCEACGGSGRRGRTLAAEVMIPDHEYLELIRAGDDIQAEQQWIKRGTESGSSGQLADRRTIGVTARDAALVKIAYGLVCPVHAEEELGLFSLQAIMADGRFEETEASQL